MTFRESVSVMHGATTFTSTPCLAHSSDSARERWCTPAFAAAYTERPWNPTTPKFDPMLMILPPPCGIITLAAAWQAKKTLFSEAVMVLSYSSSVTSSAGVVPVQPALLTRMSTRPNVSSAFAIIARTWSTCETSVCTTIALRPRLSTSACTSLISSWRPCGCFASTRCAPALASPTAMARPMPCDAPVTTAILSCNPKPE